VSYDVQPPSLTELLATLQRIQVDASHVHVFETTVVVWVLGLRVPLRLCACGRPTSNGIPDWTDRVRIRRGVNE
jgi:hypothetical protein